MLKIFRKIRQSLLAEGKVGKYFKYAVGEIILVVLGILIALQVNNWSQNNQSAKKETKMLQELLLNLRKDSLDNAENIRWYNRVKQSAKVVTTSLEKRIPWHDSLATHYGNLYTHGIATLNISAYENLKSIGFDLIGNDSIRIALTNLHAISYELVRKTEEEFAKDNYNMMILPVLTTRLKMEKWFHAVPHNYEELFDDLEFQETVRFRGITMGYVGDNTDSANRRVSSLIKMIERELKNK